MQATDYILKVSGGPDYDHLTTLAVNDEENPLFINSDHFTGNDSSFILGMSTVSI
jgi:hypothetical protein